MDIIINAELYLVNTYGKKLPIIVFESLVWIVYLQQPTMQKCLAAKKINKGCESLTKGVD